MKKREPKPALTPAGEMASLLKSAAKTSQGRGSFEVMEVAGTMQQTLQTFESNWAINDEKPKEVIKKCEELYSSGSDFFQTLVNMKLAYFSAGFYLDDKSVTWLKHKKISYPWTKLSRQIWKKWLISQNVVAFWRKPEDGELPVITLLPAQSITYSDRFGKEVLKIKMDKSILSDEEAAGLGARYTEAIRLGKELTLEESEGEYFKVLTDGAPGEGLGMPRARAALLDLATLDLLRRGDFNGAWIRKNIVRHSKKGHPIPSGTLAGQPLYFYKTDYGKKLIKHLAGISGFSELTSNFDLDMAFHYLSAEFFDKKAQVGTLERLARWGGPAAMILNHGETNANLSSALQAEGKSERQIVGEFVESIINHESFLSAVGDNPESISVGWDETIFFDPRVAILWISAAYQNGLASPPTARRWFGLNHERESEQMKAAHKDKEGVTPAFEAKQGMSSPDGGGDNPGSGAPKGS